MLARILFDVNRLFYIGQRDEKASMVFKYNRSPSVSLKLNIWKKILVDVYNKARFNLEARCKYIK